MGRKTRNAPGLKSALTALTAGLAAALAVSLAGCVPTYPKEKLPEEVKSVCKAEYDMDVEVTVVGNTMGIYYPMKGLLDAGLGISEEAWERISDLLLIASRVVLSTDADIHFYCVITQDAKLPELQVVIIKYVDDIKKGMFQHISRSESFKRTLFSINLTPQAEKERSIDEVFDRLGIEDETRQKVMNEFFKSPPVKLGDIGYWRGDFYMKEITIEEFLAEQISNRMKMDFRSEKDLSEVFRYVNGNGLFIPDGRAGYFFIQFKIQDQTSKSLPGRLREEKVGAILRIAQEVVSGYEFKNFGFLVLEDQMENAQMMVTRDDVLGLDKRKNSIKEIVNAPTGYFLGQE
jgi:hypothetical protein